MCMKNLEDSISKLAIITNNTSLGIHASQIKKKKKKVFSHFADWLYTVVTHFEIDM